MRLPWWPESDKTLKDILELKEKTGHSTVAVTEDGTPNGKLVGIVTSRDYRVSRMELDTPVSEFMTKFENLITADANTSLKEANDIIWEHKLNSLPLVDKDQRSNTSYSARTIPPTRRTPTSCSTSTNAMWSAQASTPATMRSAFRP